MVSETVLNKINEHVFGKHQLAYICVDHSRKILEFSNNLVSYGFNNLEVGIDVSDVVDFMVGADTHESLDLPMMETPSGISVSVNMLPDTDSMTVLIFNQASKMEYRSRLQQAANENELLADQQKKLMHRLEVASDELQEKNLQLKEANRLQTSFLSGVSHEFRTPLTSIIGYTDLVKSNLSSEKTLENSLSDSNTEHLRAANRSSKHLLSLVENLLDHGKLDSNEVIVRPKPTDLFEVLDDVAILLKPQCDTKDIELIFTCNFESPLTVFIDDSRLRQILINLVGNAVKFTDKGSVTVHSKWRSDVLFVSIVDTGLGISSEDLEKIRLPFWQVEGTGKAGTGLGLTITERIVELMGGELSIKSVVDQGTTVSFDLSAALVDLTEEVMPETVLPENFNILLAEDDLDIADLTMMLLAEAGVNVTHAKNGVVALELLEFQSFDLVLMDLNMPVMNGYQAIEKLRESNNSVPIVVMSAAPLGDTSHPEDLIECDAYLVKPVGVSDILRVASQLVG